MCFLFSVVHYKIMVIKCYVRTNGLVESEVKNGQFYKK